jgi:hypothetical protein
MSPHMYNVVASSLQTMWEYTSIFYSKSFSLERRVEAAGYVVHFLRVWRSWVHQSATHTLKENFISREAYQDIVLSCHSAVLIIRYVGWRSKHRKLAMMLCCVS